MAVTRAGGHVLRETGWEVESAPPGHPAAPATVVEELPEQVEHAEAPPADVGEQVESEPAPGRPDRADCPDCGKKFAVNKDGSPRKHRCLIDAAPPDVTFEEEEE